MPNEPVTVGMLADYHGYTGNLTNPNSIISADTLNYYNEHSFDNNCTPGNIKQGISMFGITGTFTSDATATAEDIAEGKTAYVNGSKMIGTASGGELDDSYGVTFTDPDGVSRSHIEVRSYEIQNSVFNKPVTIGKNITICDRIFYNCSNFNQPITLPDNATSCSYMFYNCSNFNQPVNIPNSVTNCYAMFNNCSKFNQPITIPKNVNSCSYMFIGCSNFNQPITIPNNVTSYSYMFGGCSNFNQNVDFSDSWQVNDYRGMFSGCSNLSLDTITIRIPSSGVSSYTVSMYSMFSDCTKAKLSNIYIKTGAYGSIDCMNMLTNISRSYRHNIYFNSKYNNSFNVNNSYSLVGSYISWTSMTNGFYNSYYNIYCYNNYTG